MLYDKSQIGWVLIVVMILAMAGISLAYVKQWGDDPLPQEAYILLMILFFSLLMLLYKLRVVVDDKGIHVIYGLGLIRFKINPEKINYVKEAETSFWYGWGIRFIPGGMLYNIQGSDSVEVSYIEMKEKLVRIGTQDGAHLVKAIKKRYSLV